ncbi:DUF3016 domain-containing protein [Thalassotalea sp. M1531]|uniref:DUF3016 domain-containing protein n=1 Tax=Thalassotalea algicola TaxID=2716224 RepID=A0A7Y0Q696_9GAMM|nr:DUF3016 domain-containing protein [Thalassotalea algicola]NMP31774.1 DUF3016 domain-containing protein [Thalassotalea algicola]
MMKLIRNIFTALLFTTFVNYGSLAQAATVEIEWLEPDSYRDLHPGGNAREKFRENVFAELEQTFNDLVTELPNDQVMKIVVRDIDLAGYVNTESKTRRKRFISAKYFPRIKFTYKLFDAAGSVIKAGGVNLKKPDFIQTAKDSYKDTVFGYEKQMIDEWFAFTFAPREQEE